MLGVSGEDATRAAGVRYFANGGFTDGSKEKLDNLIDFSKAYGKYALRSNGIRTTGDALSMLWTVANNSMSVTLHLHWRRPALQLMLLRFC